MTTTDWIQAISTLVLVVITAFYAWRTHAMSKAAKDQADANVKMAEEMRNAKSPSIMIKWVAADSNSKKISVTLENEGFGPALNLKWYLTYESLKFKEYPIVYPTFKVGQIHPLSLGSENFDFKEFNGLSINCDYRSILGEKFRSTLRCESKDSRSFEIIKLNSGDNND